MSPCATRLTNRIFVAGDLHLNASLNAAMIARESSGMGVVESILAQ